jgi:hypothetical protein
VRNDGRVSTALRLRYAAAGVLTGVAGLAVALAGTALLRQRLSPPDAVAEAIIQATPGQLAVRLVHLVGRWDKPLLLTGVLVGLVVLSAVAGLLARRALWAGQALFVLLGLVAAISVLTRPSGTALGLLPVLVGTVVWTVGLSFLVTPLGTVSKGAPATDAEGGPVLSAGSRREFLRRSGLVGVAALVFTVGGRYIGRKQRGVEEARARLRLPVTKGEVPAGSDVGVDGVVPWRVPASQFYRIDTAVVVPGLYGFVSATKWVVDLEVTRFNDFSAFWTDRGWSPQGPVKTESRIDVPRSNHRVTAGDVRVGGIAWAQHTGIERVEVRLDGDPWTEVEIGGVPSDDTWVQWAGTVKVDPGNHSLAVRATDKSGYTQTGARVGVLPDGATGWHTIQFTAE